VRYCHFATGNYNEQTAKIYTDVSLLTCDPDLGADTAEFFNCITGFSAPQNFRKLEMAPTGMRHKFLEMIKTETRNAKLGKKASIRAKFNSLTDPDIIKALYAASTAGVRIQLNIRGICCLVPGVEGLSEHIEVISLVDRFLEHARIFQFYHGGDDRIFISSADWMPRNLDKRIELLIPILTEPAKQKLANILDSYFLPNDKAYHLNCQGEYARATDSSSLPNTQQAFHLRAKEAFREYANRAPTAFSPHRSNDS
ncbi:MAG: RNA degradosome polyphosphate kinase, partial [Planctomycetota bacterium]|nr:RNA degradosome polyphosphate kinase [Planctomycetota bacterium]